MSSFADPIWEKIFVVVTIASFVFAGFAAIGAFSSAWIGYKITDATQAAADVKIQAANVKIAEAMAEVESAKALAAQANMIAEQERLARIKIEEKLAPRSITSLQSLAIVNSIKIDAGTSADIFVASSTQDATILSAVIFACLTSAGWHPMTWIWAGMPSMSGIIITTDPQASAQTVKAANNLTSTFVSQGIVTVRQNWSGKWSDFGGMLNGPQFDYKRAQIRIIIGDKPTTP